MTEVLAVNNYPTTERFDRLVRALQEGGAKVKAISWVQSSADEFNSSDGVALSGAPSMISKDTTLARFSPEVDAVKGSKVPVLGICFGHQLIARAFGSRVVKDREHVLRFVRTEVKSGDDLWAGFPGPLMLLESRHEIVESLPTDFELLATSETSPIAAMRHRTRRIFGIQSHPERYTVDNPDGREVVRNFVQSLG